MKQLLFVALLFILVGPLAGQTVNEFSRGGVIKENYTLRRIQNNPVLAKTTSLPESVSLAPFAPPPVDQGLQGSCASFAVAGVVGLLENQAHGYSLNNQFSPSFLFNLVNYNGNGSALGDNLQLVCDQGIPLITEFPYYDSGYATIPSLDVFRSALKHRGLSWYSFTGGDTIPGPVGGDPQAVPGFLGVNTARALLASGQPLVLVMGLTTKSNEAVLQAENWVFSRTTQSLGTTTALHAVYVIGYNDSLRTKDGKGAFRIRMSSGPNHFDHGDFWVTYQAVGLWQMMPFGVLTLRANYQPKLTIELESELQHFAGRFYSGFKVNNQVISENIFAWATIGAQQLLQKKLPERLPVDLTDIAHSINGQSSFVYFIRGPFRTSLFNGNYPKVIKLHVVDSSKGIDITINADLVITDSLFYAEWPITLTDVEDNEVLPTTYSLSQNYPNPFNPTTVINFSLPKSSLVTLKVYNLLGQEVALLVNEVLSPGTHNAKFDAGNLSSGIYVYVLKTSNFTASKKMVLVK